MDPHTVLTGLVAKVARDLLDPPEKPAEGHVEEMAEASDAELADAFRAAVGAMDPVEYESLLLTLPAEALRALAVAGYVTTAHLLYACGARSEVPGGVGDYLTETLLALPEGQRLERFVAMAWFGYAYGAATRDGPPPRGAPAIPPDDAEEARVLLWTVMLAVGFPEERADAILDRTCHVTPDSLVDLPRAYVQASASDLQLADGSPDLAELRG